VACWWHLDEVLVAGGAQAMSPAAAITGSLAGWATAFCWWDRPTHSAADRHTARKQAMNPVAVLRQLFQGKPWLPTSAQS
jgi:hypothetical protein